MSRVVSYLIWSIIALVVTLAIAAAANSPLLAWRDSVYIAAGFAGVIAMTLLLLQPMLAAGYLPGLSIVRSRRAHRWVGSILVLSIIIHVVGLWFTSPPDVIDALLFASPTPFSLWGVIAMWAVFASAGLAMFRSKFRLRLHLWRSIHKSLAVMIVAGSVIHAMKIEGTMEIVSKSVLCGLVLVATGLAIVGIKHRG